MNRKKDETKPEPKPDPHRSSREDEVDEAEKESFPASDPPESYNID